MGNLINKIGIYTFLASLIAYLILKLPFMLSILCGSSNESFYFIFGQHFLNGGEFNAPGRIYLNLFVLLYALIVKIFGFGTYAILFVHFLHTIIVILTSIFIYLVSKKIFNSSFYAALNVLFYLLIKSTPIGAWGNVNEIESSLALEAECFIVLFSFCSFFFLLKFFDSKSLLMSVLAGFFAILPLFFKASGAVLVLAYLCWFVYLFVFENKLLKEYLINFIYFFGVIVVLFALYNLILLVHKTNLLYYWKFYFSVGVYSTDSILTLKNFLKLVFNFMTRYVNSVNNFLLLFFTFIFILWGLLIKFCKFTKSLTYNANLIMPLIAIWGIGNIFSVLAPGGYGSYYYELIWPASSIFLTFGIVQIDSMFGSKKIIKILLTLFLFALFFQRILILLPTYINEIKAQINCSFLNQPESFQDPVKNSEYPNNKRSIYLKVADLCNSYLPSKQDTVYILNVGKYKVFPSVMYLYMKRYPPSAIISDYLNYKIFINDRLEVLKSDLIKNPPRIIISSEIYSLEEWQLTSVAPFLEWFNSFVAKKYNYKLYLKANPYGDKNLEEIYNIYERI